MKKTMFYGIMSASLLLASCGDSNGILTGKGEGTFYPVVNLDSEVLSASNGGGRAAGDITVDDLGLRLTSSDGTFMKSWAKVADFSSEEKFKIGNYTLEAFYGNSSDEGFEKPYYYGSTPLTVRENKETPVSLTASLANSMVTVTYSDSFKSYMDSYSATVTSVSGNGIYYAPTETRPVYVTPGSVQVAVTYTKPNGTTETVKPAAFNAEPKHHYRVNFNLTNSSGKAFLVITFDDSIEQEDVTIDLSQDISSVEPPVVLPEGFENGVAQSFVDGAVPSQALKMNVKALAGISAVTLKTTSKSLLQQGWPAELNLVGASAEYQTILNALGLNVKGLYKQVDKWAIIDFTNVIGKIGYVAENPVSTFEVTVTDLFGKTTETTVLKVEKKQIQLAITQSATLAAGATELNLTVSYNGVNLKDNVVFSYKNERGTWTTLAIKSVAETAANTYKVVLEVPTNVSTFTIRAAYGAYESETVNVTRETPNIDVEASTANTFSKRAAVRLTSSDGRNAEVAASAKLFVSTDGTNFSEATTTVKGNLIVATGLNPSTTYTMYAEAGGKKSKSVTVTTEKGSQLANADMETWEIVSGKSKYWWVSYLGSSSSSIWGTMNKLTTSEGGSSTNAFNRNGCAYCAISGTDRTTDKASGTYAAVISTVGWGGDNSAAGSISNCKNITVGSLHLGSSPASKSESVNYGVSFNSRPDALKFNYKYTAKNSADYGYAEAWVKDASGNVIASGTKDLSATGSYTSVTIPLTYKEDAAKAATICVIFRSSGNSACQTISDDNLSKPGFGNLSDGKYLGSQLYIDDVTLNY